MDELERTVKRIAVELGFQRVGIVPAGPPPHADFLRTWLDRGYAGQMRYLHKHVEIRRDPTLLLPGARSVICLAMNYHQPRPEPAGATRDARGQIACYAWGRDYHVVVRRRLDVLVDRLAEETDEAFEARPFVDTAPVLERSLAAAAGLGWIGKNTLLIAPKLGSFLFLAGVVTTLPLRPDKPIADRCGRCRRCIDACPTGAIVEPYVVDAAKCLSYLTIEHRQAIPTEFRSAMGDRVLGCDVCQRVCPHNRRAPATTESEFRTCPSAEVSLAESLTLSRNRYLAVTRGKATRRAKQHMLQRNAAIALGNVGGREHLSELRAMAQSNDPVLAEHAQWAVEQINDRTGRTP